MTAISELIPSVLEHVPRCSQVQAESAIESTVIDFLRRTKLVTHDHAPIASAAGTASYALSNPEGQQILHIKSATFDGKPMASTSEEILDLEWLELSQGFAWRYRFHDSGNRVEDWRLAESQYPGLYFQADPNSITLVGTPTEAIADALKLKLVVFPVPGVTVIPDWIYNTHHQALADGAVGMLKAMPNKGFSDRSAAQAFLDAYQDAANLAERAGLRGHQRNDRPTLRTRNWG